MSLNCELGSTMLTLEFITCLAGRLLVSNKKPAAMSKRCRFPHKSCISDY